MIATKPGWYRFEEVAGQYYWDGQRWHALMIVPAPSGDPIKDEPPKE